MFPQELFAHFCISKITELMINYKRLRVYLEIQDGLSFGKFEPVNNLRVGVIYFHNKPVAN
jgi:hypothetical protein